MRWRKCIRDLNYVGSVSASKLMHLLIPKLFVMWDESIKGKYGVGGKPEDYFSFMEKMQELAWGFLRMYAEEHGCALDEAEERLSETRGSLYRSSLTRIPGVTSEADCKHEQAGFGVECRERKIEIKVSLPTIDLPKDA